MDKFVYVSERGDFEIEVDGVRSPTRSFRGVATVLVDGKRYIGVSDYYAGEMPTEKVMLVIPRATEVKQY